jgi:hypothetical protein
MLSGFDALLLVGSWVAPQIEVDPRGGFLVGFGVVAGSAIASAWTFPPVRPRALRWLVLPLAVLLALSIWTLPDLPAALLVTCGLLAAATLLGTVVGGAIEHPGQLVLVAVVSAAADCASVMHPSGPSAAISQSEAALSLLALPWPMLGTSAIEPMLGAGDVVFTALYLSAARRHGLSALRSAVALALGFGCTALLVLVTERAVPALPLLGLAIVVAHPAARTLAVADRRRGTAIAVVAIALAAVLLWSVR